MKTLDEAIEYYQEKVENYTYLIKWLMKLKKMKKNKSIDEENICQLLYKLDNNTYEYNKESKFEFSPPRLSPSV